MNWLPACVRPVCCCVPPDPNLPVAPINKNPQANSITFHITFTSRSSEWSHLTACDISIRDDTTMLALKEFFCEKYAIPVDQQEIKLPDNADLTFDSATLNDTTKLSGLQVVGDLYVFINTMSQEG